MDLYTLDRGFLRQDTIDEFESAIWTERYFGDGDFELVVPAEADWMAKLPKGQLMMENDSPEPMILETRDIEEGLLTVKGITLTQWLNNRFIRTSPLHAVREWSITPGKVGEILSAIVQQMCIDGPYLDGTNPIGINTSRTLKFKIPGLIIGSTDTSGPIVTVNIPFGPVYDPMKELATSYEIGMKIILDFATEASYQISFHNYKGADRTSLQSVNDVVRFSEEMDSFTNVKDLESITDNRNAVFTFAPSVDPLLVTNSGHAYASDDINWPGFDYRAHQEFLDNVPESVDTAPELIGYLNQKAWEAMNQLKPVVLVDGEIVQVKGAEYGTDFFMGDIVEVEGNTGVRDRARVTEYIRAKDAAGERAYPTLAMIDDPLPPLED